MSPPWRFRLHPAAGVAGTAGPRIPRRGRRTRQACAGARPGEDQLGACVVSHGPCAETTSLADLHEMQGDSSMLEGRDRSRVMSEDPSRLALGVSPQARSIDEGDNRKV